MFPIVERLRKYYRFLVNLNLYEGVGRLKHWSFITTGWEMLLRILIVFEEPTSNPISKLETEKILSLLFKWKILPRWRNASTSRTKLSRGQSVDVKKRGTSIQPFLIQFYINITGSLIIPRRSYIESSALNLFHSETFFSFCTLFFALLPERNFRKRFLSWYTDARV